jgi:hypothetical protein
LFGKKNVTFPFSDNSSQYSFWSPASKPSVPSATRNLNFEIKEESGTKTFYFNITGQLKKKLIILYDALDNTIFEIYVMLQARLLRSLSYSRSMNLNW